MLLKQGYVHVPPAVQEVYGETPKGPQGQGVYQEVEYIQTGHVSC